MFLYAGLLILAIGALAIWRGFYLLNKFTFRDLKKLLVQAQDYNRKGIEVLISIAAEGCRNEDEADSLLADYLFVMDHMDEAKINGHLSIKPASFVAAGWPTAKKIKKLEAALSILARHAAKSSRGVWLDEERLSDETWVEPVKGSMVLDKKFTNLSWRVRCYLKNASKRVSEYVDWHRLGARFGVGLCRGAYVGDKELDDLATEVQLHRLAGILAREGLNCAVASHTIWSPLVEKKGMLSLHMLHGRKEVGEILESDWIKKYARERAVYIIWGRDLRSLLPYVLRRLLEKPSIFWRG